MLELARKADPSGRYLLVDDGDYGPVDSNGSTSSSRRSLSTTSPASSTASTSSEVLRRLLEPDGRIVLLDCTPEMYVNETVSFTVRDFPENRTAKSGEEVRCVMKDVEDRRPVTDILWLHEDYLALFADSGLEVVAHHSAARPGRRALRLGHRDDDPTLDDLHPQAPSLKTGPALTRYRGPMSSPRVPGGVVPASRRPREALIANPTALDAWKDITPLARNEFICWVEDAKQEMTRERRIRRTEEELEEGPASALLLARLQAPRAHWQLILGWLHRGRVGQYPTVARVVVVGGSGFYGRYLVADVLARTDADVVIASRTPDAVSSPRVMTERVDLRNPHALSGVLDGAAAVVHCAGPFETLPVGVLEAAISSGVPYIDVSENREFARRVIAHHDAAVTAGIPVLTGASVAPGLVLLHAREAMSRCDEVESVETFAAPDTRKHRGAGMFRTMLYGAGRRFDEPSPSGSMTRHGWAERSRAGKSNAEARCTDTRPMGSPALGAVRHTDPGDVMGHRTIRTRRRWCGPRSRRASQGRDRRRTRCSHRRPRRRKNPGPPRRDGSREGPSWRKSADRGAMGGRMDDLRRGRARLPRPAPPGVAVTWRLS